MGDGKGGVALHQQYSEWHIKMVYANITFTEQRKSFELTGTVAVMFPSLISVIPHITICFAYFPPTITSGFTSWCTHSSPLLSVPDSGLTNEVSAEQLLSAGHFVVMSIRLKLHEFASYLLFLLFFLTYMSIQQQGGGWNAFWLWSSSTMMPLSFTATFFQTAEEFQPLSSVSIHQISEEFCWGIYCLSRAKLQLFRAFSPVSVSGVNWCS